MRSDYLIVGGGIYGVGTAWGLSRQGHDVVVLEADEIASGASGGLGKRGVRANGRDPQELELASRAYELWPRLEEVIGSDIGYERTGHLLLYEKSLARTGGGFPSANAQAQLQNALGVPTEQLDAHIVRDREPTVSENVIGALYCPNDGVADHTAATRGLGRAAVENGVEIHENTRVTGFVREGGLITAVTTEAGEHYSVDEGVLVAGNYGTVTLLESAFDISLPVYKRYPQVIATEPVPDHSLSHLIGHDHRRLAVKMLPDHRVMLSGGWSGKEQNGRGVTVSDQVDGNMREARAVFPWLRNVDVADADASRPETIAVDEIPIIDRVPSAQNLIYATGWSGHGFAISLAISELLASWLVTNDTPGLLEPFHRDRFSQRTPVNERGTRN